MHRLAPLHLPRADVDLYRASGAEGVSQLSLSMFDTKFPPKSEEKSLGDPKRSQLGQLSLYYLYIYIYISYIYIDVTLLLFQRLHLFGSSCPILRPDQAVAAANPRCCASAKPSRLPSPAVVLHQ